MANNSNRQIYALLPGIGAVPIGALDLGLDPSGKRYGAILTAPATGAVFTTTAQGIYHNTPLILADGTAVQLQVDVNGKLIATLGDYLSGEDPTIVNTNSATGVNVVEQRFRYFSITDTATHVLISGPCLLGTLDMTAIATGVIKIYDDTVANASNLIRTITSPSVLLQNEVTKWFGLLLNNGLTVVTSVAAQNILIGAR